jgi:DNA-binding NtrC family response regulator
MTGPRLALVADDQRLVSAVQAHLKQALGQPAFHCRTDALREHLTPQSDGLLLLVPPAPYDAEAVQFLLQEIRLLQLPPVLLLLDGSASLFEGLDERLAVRLRWPAEADAVVVLVRERLGHQLHLHPGSGELPREESVTAVIRRRLLGYTPSLLSLLERIALAALHDVTVLLTGETGTGKTYLARLMHDCSPRRREPFLSVPCGAQPANLVESVFFGHVKGAFTGADRAKVGKFAVAGKGTLLLDEIDTLTLEAQAGLLRVIETGDYEPVGGNETLHCDARIIVASNWDLEGATREGRFPPDLYYRLNVMSFHLPPLRERVQDVNPLVRGMAARFNTKFRKQLLDISPEALAALENYDWPGNIRQLENVVQQAVLVSKGTVLTPEDLPAPVRDCKLSPRRNGSPATDSLSHSRESAERSVILRALQEHNYSRSQTARSLRISRVTLYKKMKKYGLDDLPRDVASL